MPGVNDSNQAHSDTSFAWLPPSNSVDVITYDSTAINDTMSGMHSIIHSDVDRASLSTNDTTLAATHHDKDSGLFVIQKKSLLFIHIVDEKVDKDEVLVNGSREDKELQAFNKKYDRRSASTFDAVPDIPQFYMKDNLIYEFNDEFLGKGYPYDSAGTVYTIHRVDTITVQVGQTGILRKLDKKFWVLNLYTTVLGDDPGWWIIRILEKTGHGTMRVWDCDEKLSTHSSMFYGSGGDYPNYFFDSRWSASEMLQLIRDGYFKPEYICQRHY